MQAFPSCFVNNPLLDPEKIPSVYAMEPEEGVSERYTFIPTTRVITLLHDLGWEVSEAKQVGSRKADPRYAQHRVRFRPQNTDLTRKNSKVGEHFPEINLYNSHNRLSGYRLVGGIFVKACSNGMCISDTSFESLYMRHQDYTDVQVIDFSRKFVNDTSHIMQKIDDWSQRVLEEDEKSSLAAQAAYLRWNEDALDIAPKLLQTFRSRYAGKNDLWSVINVVQENIIRGGFMHPRTKRVIRPIKAINRDRELNQAIWDLGLQFAD